MSHSPPLFADLAKDSQSCHSNNPVTWPYVDMQALDNLSFMRTLRDAGMKLIITSPPYNIGKSYEKRTSLEQYLSEQKQVIAQCVRLLHPEGSLCWQVGNYIKNGELFPLDMVLYPLFMQHGLKLRNRIIWHFEHGLHCQKRLSGRHESILWFTKSDHYTFHLDPIRVPAKYPNKKYFKGSKIGQLSGNPLGKNPGDVWIFPNVKNNHVEKNSSSLPISSRTCRTLGVGFDKSRR